MGQIGQLAWCVATVSALLLGCAASPVGQRLRVAELPLAAAQADLEFALRADLRTDLRCLPTASCPADASLDAIAADRFADQLHRVAGTLAVGARARYPALMGRLPDRGDRPFALVIVTGQGAAISSSADGRIAVDAALATDAPDDGVVAFILAREMAHVLARHHAENASTGFVVSALLNAVLPGSGALKTLLAAGGARWVAKQHGPAQAHEADVMAVELLGASGYRLADVAASLKRAAAPDAARVWSAPLRDAAAALGAVAVASDLAALPARGAP